MGSLLGQEGSQNVTLVLGLHIAAIGITATPRTLDPGIVSAAFRTLWYQRVSLFAVRAYRYEAPKDFPSTGCDGT